jgi:hypothetical protein
MWILNGVLILILFAITFAAGLAIAVEIEEWKDDHKIPRNRRNRL